MIPLRTAIVWTVLIAGSLCFLKIQPTEKDRLKAEIEQGQREINAAHASMAVKDEIAIRLWEKQSVLASLQEHGK